MKRNIISLIVALTLLIFCWVLYDFTKNLQILFSAIVAFATIAYVYLTAQLISLNKDIRDIQKRQLDPNINIDFQHDERALNLVNMIIENTGRSVAKEVDITIEPDMEYFKGNKLSDLPLIKNKHDIPPNKRIKFFLTNMLENIEEKTKEPYKISVNYKNEDGEQFHKEFEIDLGMLKGALIAEKDDPLENIKKSLDTLSRDFANIARGFKKIKIISYTIEEDKEEQEEKMKKTKEMIEKEKDQKK